MFYISKTMEISASHSLKLDYESPCNNLHGHNWKITVHCKSDKLNNNGMITDFSTIKKVLNTVLDHTNLNKSNYFENINTTAENMSFIITKLIPNCYKTEIWETENNYACYEKDEDE